MEQLSIAIYATAYWKRTKRSKVVVVYMLARRYSWRIPGHIRDAAQEFIRSSKFRADRTVCPHGGYLGEYALVLNRHIHLCHDCYNNDAIRNDLIAREAKRAMMKGEK